jgi:hypothetical protein
VSVAKPVLVQFPRGETLRNAPAKLRLLADAIERGDYGEVSTVGVAIMGSTFECLGWGDGLRGESVGPSCFALFGAAQLRLLKEIEAHGRDAT